MQSEIYSRLQARISCYTTNYLSTTLNIQRKHKLYPCLREIHLVKVTQGAIQRELLLFASFTSNFHQRDLFPRGKRWFAWYFVAVYINAVVLNRYASRKLCLFSGYLFDRNIAKTWRICARILYTETCITNADTSAASTRGRSRGLNLALANIPPSQTVSRVNPGKR